MKIYGVILAAGKGTRMKSDLPKVLHEVCGKPMIQYLVDTLKEVGVDDISVVIGHGGEQVKEAVRGSVTFVEQKEQLGTAHAVMQAKDFLEHKEGMTLVLTGDTPLITKETIQLMIKQKEETRAKGIVLTAIHENPTGYGRILRDEAQQTVTGIVEEKDANTEQKKITEVNTGLYCFDNTSLFQSLHDIQNQNAQSEYYLTDIVEVFRAKGYGFEGCVLQDNKESLGINSRVQLAEAEAVLRERINTYHMNQGVTMIDPKHTYIDSDVIIGENTTIYPGVVIKGATAIGKDVVIHSGSEILHSVIGNRSIIRQSVIHNTHVGEDVQIGPFAHLRPHTVVQNRAKVGNFVELKKSTLGEGSKVNHLSYIGDATVGKKVNIGCGAITVNYDGKKKSQTVIDDGAFVGCNVNLVAPVTIGKDTIVAAGSTITKDVPDDALALARTKQENKEGYASKLKKRL